MDLRQLRYFLAITEAGSITRASEIVGVAQPALSLHVKAMEEHLGTQLLVRSKTGVAPTEAGKLLAQRARAILEDLARTEDDIRTLDADPVGTVRIGLPGTIADIVALPLIEAACERYPRIRRFQTDENRSQERQDHCPLYRKETPPLSESSGAVGLEGCSGVEVAFQIEMVMDGDEFL